jgi:hypothetical protein
MLLLSMIVEQLKTRTMKYAGKLLAILPVYTGATWFTSPNEACPGLHLKPLDAAIGQAKAPYCPDGHHCIHGSEKQQKCQQNTTVS